MIDARTAALQGLIDYAGLFPPESLAVADAVDGFRAARSDEQGWMVDRFLVPVSRLAELVGALIPSMTAGEATWPLAVVLDAGPSDSGAQWSSEVASDLARVRAFVAELSPAVEVTAVEMVAPVPLQAEPAHAVIEAMKPLQAMPFFEVAVAADPPEAVAEQLGALAQIRRSCGMALGAKIRCGGADAVPAVEAVAGFVARCQELNLPFKATAGLHHPVRHLDPDLGGERHGFLNLLAASAAAGAHELTTAQLAAILGDTDPAGFRFTDAGLVWRDLEMRTEALVRARRDRMVGFGSCSFTEPVEALFAMGVLPVGTTA